MCCLRRFANALRKVGRAARRGANHVCRKTAGTQVQHAYILTNRRASALAGLSGSDSDAILNELAGTMEPVMTHYQWRPQLRDPADEMVLEAAANAQAQAIVTYNLRDFGPAKLFGIPVLNPEQTFQHFRLKAARSTQP